MRIWKHPPWALANIRNMWSQQRTALTFVLHLALFYLFILVLSCVLPHFPLTSIQLSKEVDIVPTLCLWMPRLREAQ